MGPELRQYLFSGDNEGKPFSRNDYKNIVLAVNIILITSFGTTRDYQDGFYIQNTMFPMQRNEIFSSNTQYCCYQHSFIKSRMSVYLVVKNIVYRQDLSVLLK